MLNRKRKLLLSLLTLGLASVAAGFGTFSAFSSTTTNDANSFAAGTVYIADNDAGSALYALTNQAPLASTASCIKLTYTGSLAADVKLYTGSSIATLGQYVDLTIEKGTVAGAPAFPACTGFTAVGGPIYSGTLANFATTSSSYASGIAAFPAAQTQWNQNDTLVYRFTVALQDNAAANGGASPLSTGAHSFTWEARNQ